MIEILWQVPLFSGLNDGELQRIAAITRRRDYRKGELIFSTGDPATGLFIMEFGQVRIYQLSSKGREQVLHLFGPGEVFAEVAVFAGELYLAFAEALTDLRLLFILKRNFLDLIRRHPGPRSEDVGDPFGSASGLRGANRGPFASGGIGPGSQVFAGASPPEG